MSPFWRVPTTVWTQKRSGLSDPLRGSLSLGSAAEADGERKSPHPPPDSRTPWKTLRPTHRPRVYHSSSSRGGDDLKD